MNDNLRKRAFVHVNILITSVSAKIQLVEAFKDALGSFGGGRVVGTDSDPAACAAHFVDVFERVPADKDPDFARVFIDICKRHKVTLVVPTRDAELPLLLSLQNQLAEIGVTVPIPAAETLDICLNKSRFHDFCLENKYPVLPRREPKTEDDFPVFVRLYSGSGGRSAFLVPDMAIWQQMQFQGDDHICQPLCKDQEYSVDLISDLDGKALQAVSRARQRVIYGESWRSEIRHEPALESLCMRIANHLELKGHTLFQAFVSNENGINLIEINPRFGGCSTLSIAGGLDSPNRLIQMVAGQDEEAARQRAIKYGLQSNRFARDILIQTRSGE